MSIETFKSSSRSTLNNNKPSSIESNIYARDSGRATSGKEYVKHHRLFLLNTKNDSQF